MENIKKVMLYIKNNTSRVFTIIFILLIIGMLFLLNKDNNNQEILSGGISNCRYNWIYGYDCQELHNGVTYFYNKSYGYIGSGSYNDEIGINKEDNGIFY